MRVLDDVVKPLIKQTLDFLCGLINALIFKLFWLEVFFF